MKCTPTKISDVIVIEPDTFGDNRGWFMESFNKKKFENMGINTSFVQDNHSLSAIKGTLRGLHFQKNPMAQTKLVRCTRGEILDIAVDLRKESPNYKKWVAVKLSQQNQKQLYIPKGFAHGFVTLADNVEVQYKVDSYYSKEHDRGIRYDDPELEINWGIEDIILSDKDEKSPYLKDSDANFI